MRRWREVRIREVRRWAPDAAYNILAPTVPRMRLPAILFQRFFLGSRDLVLLWVGQLASGFGDALTFMGFLFLALQLTGSESAVGAFQTIAYIPIILFGLAAGVYVDRRDRRRVMLLADGVRALVLGAMPVLAAYGLLSITVAGIGVMIITTMMTFFNPAYNSSLPAIVGDPAKLFRVNAVMQSSRQFAAIAGPAIAALGIARNGPATLLGINAVAYVGSFIAIACIGTSLAARQRSPVSLAILRREAMVGLRAVMADGRIRTIFVLTLANNLLLMGPAIVGTAVLVKKDLAGSLGDYAGVELMYALGMTIAGVVLHQLPRIRAVGRLWAIGLVFDGFTFLLYLWADSFPLLYLFTFIHALGIPLIVVSRATIMQRIVPAELLGRTFGYIDIAVYGVTALSAAITGLCCQEFGARLTIVYGGALAGVVGVIALAQPHVRRLRFSD